MRDCRVIGGGQVKHDGDPWEPPSAPLREGLRRRLAFEPGRTDLAEGRVSTLLVIEHFDEVEQGHLRLAVAVEAFSLLAFDGGEEALHDR